MTGRLHRTMCVILAIILIITSNVYAVGNNSGSNFTGTILVESASIDKNVLDEITIDVYQSTPVETDGNYIVYSDEYAFSVSPDKNGFFSFERPSSVFSLTVQIDSLPNGYGIDHHTSMYLPEDISDTFVLSLINKAEIVSNDIKYPGIILFNDKGEEVYTAYTFEPTYHIGESGDDALEIGGTVGLGNNIEFAVSKHVELPDIGEINKIDLLYEIGAISEADRITKYIELYKNETRNIDCSTPIIDTILDFYESDEYQLMPEALKMQVETFLQIPEEYEVEYPNAISNSYFTIHYSNDVTKTVAQNTLSYLTSLRSIASNEGFRMPIKQPLYSTIQVYITSEVNAETNGKTFHDKGATITSPSTIYIYNLNNLSAEDKETIAHEFFHAIQNSYFKTNCWFKESAAVWFAAKYSGSIKRATYHFNKYFRNSTLRLQKTEYGAGVFPMAIDIAYGGTSTIRKIYERLNAVATVNLTETDLEAAITWAIKQHDNSGSFAEAFKKLGAYTTLPDHFFSSIIPSNAKWSNNSIDSYTPSTTSKTITTSLESFGLDIFQFNPSSSVPKKLEIVIDFSGTVSTSNSLRFVRKTASGSIIPFGGDASSTRYSAVMSQFCSATSTADNILSLYVAPINAAAIGSRNVNVSYKLTS